MPLASPLIPRALLCLLCTLSLMACDDKKPANSTPPEVGEPTAKVEGAGDPSKTKKDEVPVPSRDGLVTTFDLVANRHLAHVHDAGLTIDLGQGSALKYVQGRWKNPWFDAQKADDGSTFAYPSGPGATMRFPLGDSSGTTDDSWTIQARLMPVGKQNCDVFINVDGQDEKKFASLTLDEGWKTYDIKLPEGLPMGQEASLRFHFSRSRDVAGVGASAAGFDWVRIGQNLGDVAPARQRDIFDAAKKSITLKKGQQVSWYTTLGDTPRLVAQLEGSAQLLITADGKPAQTIELSGSSAHADLTAWANQAVRLTLQPGAEGATLKQPALATKKGEAKALKAPKYVVVWLIDTLRADHMKAYNPKTDVQTPNLDAYIADAALFERAAVQGNSSLPSSASIFSGSYPPTHGLVKESARHQKDDVLLGEGMKKAGMRTGLFSSNGYVSKKWGFARGFDHEFNPIREEKPSKAEFLWPEAKTWLEAQIKADADAPVFVYLNTSDPHVPYAPPEAQLKLYHTGGKVGRVNPRGTGELLHDMAKKSGPKLNAAEVAYMRSLYKGEITYNDVWFGKMLADLDALGIRDETMVIITSDHGEEFGEYGRFGHGTSVNQELVDVPLIIGYSPWTKGGVKVDDAVEALDIYPTLLDAMGQPQSDWGKHIQGKSLVPHITDSTDHHSEVSFSYHNDFLRAARIEDLKYHLYQGDKDPLFEVSYHPTTYANSLKPEAIDGEDVSGKRPVARRMMRDVMAFQVGFDDLGWARHIDGAPNNHSSTRAKTLDVSW